MTTIQIDVRNVYGNRVAYPVCEKAVALAAIANTKTLTIATLVQALKLGFTVVITGRQAAGFNQASTLISAISSL